MNKRIGKFLITTGMLKQSYKTVQTVIKDLEILDVDTSVKDKIVYTVLSSKFDPIPERNPTPWYEFNIINGKLILERKR